MKVIRDEDVAGWYRKQGLMSGLRRAQEVLRMTRYEREPESWSLAADPRMLEGPAKYLELSPLLSAALSEVLAERPETGDEEIPSLPFFSLCYGLFLPLSGMTPQRIGELFRLDWPHEPPSREQRAQLISEFLEREVGLTLYDKICLALGDPFGGKRPWVGRDTLISALAHVDMRSSVEVLEKLPRHGEVARLAAEFTERRRSEPPLTALEVIYGLRHLRRLKYANRREVVLELLERAGRLERYFLCALILRKTHFRYQLDTRTLAEVLAQRFEAEPEQVLQAFAIVDVFETARRLEQQGTEGLREVHLKPLVPLAPQLAGASLPAPGQAAQATGTVDLARITWPLWVERKYDGVRLLVHKSSDALGQMIAAAYTRNRQDWSELVPGLHALVKLLPCASCILDGELHGHVLEADRLRPADVYEVYGSLRGETAVPVRYKYTVFDVLYLNGEDLTRQPLTKRRKRLSELMAPLGMMPQAQALPVPIELAEGQLVEDEAALNRLHEHFRRQGYEGSVAKMPNAPYVLGQRSSSWMKRKPIVTLDFVVTGAFFAVESAGHRMFNPWLVSARDEETRGFAPVATASGLGRAETEEMVRLIMTYGLPTGRQLVHAGSSGRQPGIELKPFIVVTVKFEAVVDTSESPSEIEGLERPSAPLSLRSPQIVHIRSNEQDIEDTATLEDLHAHFTKQRLR